MAITFTEEIHHNIKHIKAAWTSDSAGAASGTTTEYYDGLIYRLITVPGTTTDAPTDNYDITVVDKDSVDVLMGAGADRDATATEYVVADDLGAVSESQLTFAVTNSGDVTKGTIHLYII